MTTKEREKTMKLFPVKIDDLCIGERFVFHMSSVVYTYIGNHHYAGRAYILYENELITYVERYEDIENKTLFRR